MSPDAPFEEVRRVSEGPQQVWPDIEKVSKLDLLARNCNPDYHNTFSAYYVDFAPSPHNGLEFFFLHPDAPLVFKLGFVL